MRRPQWSKTIIPNDTWIQPFYGGHVKGYVLSIFFGRGVAAPMGQAAKPLIFEGFKKDCDAICMAKQSVEDRFA